MLYRPFHLCGTEAPLSIAEAAVLGRPTGTPRPVPVADVVAYTKRALPAGGRLDGSGGETVYGLIERAAVARHEQLLPLGLADGVAVNKALAADCPITWDDVELDETAFALQRRREQDALW